MPAKKKAAKKSARKRTAKRTRGKKAASPAAQASQAGPNKWVVLIYMAATSPKLRDIMERDLIEMRDRLRVLGDEALRAYALMDTPDSKYAARIPLHRPDDETRRAGERDVEAMPVVDQDRARDVGAKAYFLSELLKWRFASPRLKPFNRTLLILWGHSQGVAAALSRPGSPAYAMVGNGGFGFNDLSGDSLSLPQIRRAIAAGLADQPAARIDLLSFDSCFMSAAEVSAEFQPTSPDGDATEAARVDYVVASQSAVLLDGLDYGRIADAFVDGQLLADISPRDLGTSLLQQASSGNRSPASLSLLWTGETPRSPETGYERFSAALRVLVHELSRILDTGTRQPEPDTPPLRERFRPSKGERRLGSGFGVNRSEWLRIRDAFEAATWHRVRQFIDVADLCRRLANNSRVQSLRDAALDVMETLRPGAGIVRDVRSTPPLVLSGFSIYCPWLFPTPEQVRQGAWNAVVDLYDYATGLWFNAGDGSWGAFVFHAKHVLEESRQRAINSEIADVRAALSMQQYPWPSGYLPAADRQVDMPADQFLGADKPGNDLFQSAEPAEADDAGGPRLGPAAAFSSLRRAQGPQRPSDIAACLKPANQVALSLSRVREHS